MDGFLDFLLSDQGRGWCSKIVDCGLYSVFNNENSERKCVAQGPNREMRYAIKRQAQLQRISGVYPPAGFMLYSRLQQAAAR